MKPPKLTKAQYNAMSMILSYTGPFSARTVAQSPRTLDALANKGILERSEVKYHNSDAQLYTINRVVATAAYQAYPITF